MEIARAGVIVIPEQIYTFECFDKDGNLKWREIIHNLTVNTGLDDILDKYWKGSAYTAAHYLGLLTGTTIQSTDTMALHSGWTEFTGYSSPTTRGALSWGTVSGQQVSATAIAFSISASGTVDGGFVTTDGTISGTAGTLIGAATFTGGAKTVANGDTLNVTVTASASSA